MKTALKHNVIETFQRQLAWRNFIETITDSCSGLFDNHFVSDVDGDTDSMSEYTLFDETHSNPKALGLYELINNRYILTTDESAQNGKTYYTKSIDDSITPLYSVFDYINSGVSLTQMENISLKGLLRTLSMYGCRIEGIEQKDSNLPHTYKLARHWLMLNTPYGYDVNNTELDYIAQAIVDGVDSQNVGCLIEGESDDDIVDYDYIHNIYGYNQKNPVILVSQIKEVKEYALYVQKQSSTYLSYPSNVYADFSEYDNPNTLYQSNNNGKSGIKPIPANLVDDIKSVLASDYTLQKTNGVTTKFKKWVYIEDENSSLQETAYILNDKSRYDLMLNDRIIYNRADGDFDYLVSLSVSNSTQPQRLHITRKALSASEYETIGTLSEAYQTTVDAKTYYVYEDSLYKREWIVIDKVEDFFNISPSYLKNQVYNDESAVKAQPLFVYEEKQGLFSKRTLMSMCANMIDKDVSGGEGRITYEIEKQDVSKVVAPIETADNITGTSNEIKGVHYGDYFYKWEQYAQNNDTFNKAVYTPLNYSKNNFGKETLSYFFDGGRNVFYVSPTDSDYYNNKEKEIDDVKYVNTFEQEFFETMYFNHFIKVYPIDAVVDNQVVKTKKLYCDNLELVQFGNIVPYVVSYCRKGESEENTETNSLYNDIDCSIFSKILSYNKRTHLITLEDYVYFSNDSEQQYLVVAYQNASPFNKIQSITIVTPDSVKDVIEYLLENYKNNYNYHFNVITETEYQESLQS